MQVGLRLPECDQCTAHHTLVLDAIQSLAEEAVHEKQLQVPVLGALNVAEFAANVMEHKKTPHVLSVCVYVVHVPMHNTPFLNLSHPLCSRGKHSPSHAEEVIFCHQSHWWSQGCSQCFCPLRAPSLPTQTLSVLVFFLHSLLSGRKRETWEGFFVRSHFPPSVATATWNYLPSHCHLAAAFSWSSLPQLPLLQPARLMSGYISASGAKYPLLLSVLHPFILAAWYPEKWRREEYWCFLIFGTYFPVKYAVH